jgi:hypothetical protein
MDAATTGILATAALGLAGILATFFAPAWSQRVLERRREARAFRKACNLVGHELLLAYSALGVMVGALDNGGLVQGAHIMEEQAWEAHGGVLGEALVGESWMKLAAAYTGIRFVKLRVSTDVEAADVAEPDKALIREILDAVTEAREALAHAIPARD